MSDPTPVRIPGLEFWSATVMWSGTTNVLDGVTAPSSRADATVKALKVDPGS